MAGGENDPIAVVVVSMMNPPQLSCTATQATLLVRISYVALGICATLGDLRACLRCRYENQAVQCGPLKFACGPPPLDPRDDEAVERKTLTQVKKGIEKHERTKG